MHSGFDQTSPVITAPLAPDLSPAAAGGAKAVVSGIDTGRVRFPWSTIAAGRDDGNGQSRGNGRVAMAAWQARLSQAPSALTLPMGWSAGIWSGK